MSLTDRPTTETNHVVTPDGKGMPAVAIVGPGGEEALVAEFGDLITSGRRDQIALKFQYGLSAEQAYSGVSGSGAVTTPNAKLRLATGATPGSHAYMETDHRIIYRPGHEAYGLLTLIFTPPPLTGGGSQRIGAYNTTPTVADRTVLDGAYVEASAGTYWCKLVSGGTVLAAIPRDQWDDKMDGSGPSRYTWNPAAGNIGRIRYGHLGFAPVRFWLDSPAGQINFCTIDRRGTGTLLNFENPFLPIRAEVYNGTGTDNLVLETGSINGGIIGDPQVDPEAKHFCDRNENAAVATGTLTNLITIKAPATFNGKRNHIFHSLTSLTVAWDGTKNAEFRVIKNATLSGAPGYNDVQTGESTMQYTHDASTVTGGRLIFVAATSKTGQQIAQYDHDEMLAGPEDSITIAVISTGAGDGLASIRWHEYF